MKKFITAFLLLSGLIVQPLFSQTDSIISPVAISDTQDVDIRLFDSDEPLDIALRFDITYYKRKKPDTSYMDAILTYYTGDKDSVNKNIKIKARGEVRRTICDFPPLFLNFKMKDSLPGEFIGINKLKVVPYCKIGYEDYVLREYLVYKLYNILTDNSLKVRLFRINFINTAKATKPLRQFGFAIEPLKLYEKRTNSLELEKAKLSRNYIKPEMLDRCAIFNYMIGNTDWSVPNQHNCKILISTMPDRASTGIIVPYDFDYSGLINATYAVPHESLPIETVRERLFQGLCRSDEEFLSILGEFAAKKEAFYDVINNFPYLDEKEKKSMISYLDQFFDGINKRNSILYDIKQNCKDL